MSIIPFIKREELTDACREGDIGGNYTPFFAVCYIESVYKSHITWGITNCHDIAAKSSFGYNDQWVFHIINYYDEDINIRIGKFLELFKKLQPITNLSEPEITIIDDINIKISCKQSEYKGHFNRLLFLKLFRFSYSYHGETIGQLFLNQRYYNSTIDYDNFTHNSDSLILSRQPNVWFYELVSKTDLNNQDFLNGLTLNSLYKQHEIYSSIRFSKEELFQFLTFSENGASVPFNTSNT